MWTNHSTVDFVNKGVSTTDKDIHTLFNTPKENKRTVSNDKVVWKGYYREFQNWNRLNAIMAISSYFEVYLASIISTAIESDPGLQFGVAKKIDGAMLLKHSTKYSFNERANEIIIGEWPQRISKFHSTFGHTPTTLRSSIGELEKMRVLRNKVGHAFGRDIDQSKRKGTIKTLDIERVSLKVLKKQLGLIYKCVKSMDKYMVENHIGSYEEIYYYHAIIHSNAHNLNKGSE